jgi:hypothetical protein
LSFADDARSWLEGPCRECGFDASAVPSSDLPDAIRAIGTRYRAPLTRGLKDEDLRSLLRAHPVEGAWSALEYACHVRDLLPIFEARTQRMLTEDDPALGWWDHDAAVVADRYDEQDPVAVADSIAAGAESYAAALERVPADAWDRPGQRADIAFTVQTKAQYALHEANHHLLDIGRVLRAARGR